jgi:hypothetical protein
VNTQTITKAIITLMAFIFCIDATAQQSELGSWHVINARYHFNDKWHVFVEGQLRSQKLADDFFYHELKTGLSYTVAPHTALLLGIGQYGTYQTDGNFKTPMQSHEFRIWEQLILNNEIGLLKLEHRYRVEQRFSTGNYRNRLRYRLSGTLPVSKRGMEPGGFFVNASEEVFLTNRPPYFERSRVTAGIGYIFSKLFTWQVGFLNQFDYSKSHISSSKNFIQSSLLFELHPKPSKKKTQ